MKGSSAYLGEVPWSFSVAVFSHLRPSRVFNDASGFIKASRRSPLNVTTASHWLGSSPGPPAPSRTPEAGLRWEVRVALMGFDLL